MKKRFIRLIALSLAVLMLFSFPFCAFAGEGAVYQTPVLGGEQNPVGQYSFTPERSGEYWSTAYLSDCTSPHYLNQGEECHQYTFYKGETYYFNAEQPFGLTLQERGTMLGEGANDLFVDETGETIWTFIPSADAVWRFSSYNEASAIAVYNGEILLGSTNGRTPLAL